VSETPGYTSSPSAFDLHYSPLGWTSLHFAVASRRFDTALLQLGADPNITDDNGVTCLQLSIKDQAPGLLRILLGLDQSPKLEEEPLSRARVLSAVDFFVRDIFLGYSVFSLLIKLGMIEELEQLVKRFPKHTQRIIIGDPRLPLSDAIASGAVSSVEFLLKHKSPVEFPETMSQITPLCYNARRF
jgi:ankyrin repeat protein